MIDVPCLCGSSAAFKIEFEQNFREDALTELNFSARGNHDRAAEHLHYRIVRCRGCGQLYSTPILEQEVIDTFYRRSVHTYGGETENIVRAYMAPLRKRAGLLRARDAALEVGCGSGFYLRSLQEFGFRRLLGIEPSADAVSQAAPDIRPLLVNAPYELVPLEDESFDLICAFQVLDHFRDPRAVMRSFYRVLRPGGLCYAIIHNERALQVKLLGDKSPIIDVSHIYYFNRVTLKRIFQETGFEVVAGFDIWNAYRLKTWLRMAPLPFKNALAGIVSLVHADELTLSIPAGNIGIIARKVS